MHLLPEAISNPTTPSGSMSEKPAFLSALHTSLVIFLSPSHHGCGLAASSIFSFIKFNLTSVAKKSSGGSAGVISSCLESLWIARILILWSHTWWAHSLKSILTKEVTTVAVGYMKCWQWSVEMFHLICQLLYTTWKEKIFFPVYASSKIWSQKSNILSPCLCQILNSVICP